MPTALLILPTGTYRADEYLAAADRLGIDVVTASERGQAMAEVMGDRFLEVPLDDPERAAQMIAEHGRRITLDAVVAVDDEGLLTAALAAQALGLRHSPAAAVRRTRDKAAMRARFDGDGVAQPRFEVVWDGDPVAAVAAAGRIGLPVVVKPCSLSGSRGVIRADDSAAVADAAAWANRILAEAGERPGAPLLVEEFVPGREVAVEAIITDGRLDVVTVFDKPDPLDGPYFEETLYLSPTTLPPDLLSAVVGATVAAVGSIGLTDGPVHAELRVPGTADRPVAVLEVAGRTIGGRCSKALALGGGATLEDLVLARAVGLAGPEPRLIGPAGVLMIPIPHTGRLRAVDGVDEVRQIPGITGIEITVPPGRELRAVPEAERYLGFVFAAATTRDEVETALRAALDTLHVDIDPVGGGRR